MKISIGAKSIAFPAPVWVICTYDKNEIPNAMTSSWGGICCSDPPCISVALRRETYTYKNILNKKCFTINIATEKHVVESNYFGIASGKNINKFIETGLKPVKSEIIDAPYIEEFPLVIECLLKSYIDLGSHTILIAKIINLKVDSDCLNINNIPDIEKIRPLIYSPGERKYFSLGNFIKNAF